MDRSSAASPRSDIPPDPPNPEGKPPKPSAATASPPLGFVSLWRDLHDRHWMLHAFHWILHFYAGRGRKHFYLVTNYAEWDHPNLWYPEFRRVWALSSDRTASPRCDTSTALASRSAEGGEALKVIARYGMHHSPYEDEFDTLDEAFSFLAYGHMEAGTLAAESVTDGATVYRRGEPEFERRFQEALDRLS